MEALTAGTLAKAKALCDRLARGPAHNWINGRLTTSVKTKDSSTFDDIEPRSGRLLCNIQNSDAEDVNKAVNAASKAFHAWRQMNPADRGKLLIDTASILRKKSSEIAYVDTVDNGKPLYEAISDMDSVTDCLEHFGHLACLQTSSINSGEYIPMPHDASSSRMRSYAYVTRQPFGVVGAIGAWNYALQTLAWKLGPALACGNTMVFKPSPLTPLTALTIAEAMQEAGVPDGVLNIVQGEAETGSALTAHKLCHKLSFTGSVPTGMRIMEAASKRIANVSLELGGKSPLIIFDDVKSIETAVRGAAAANFFTQGAVCSNGTRIYVQSGIYDKFVENFASSSEQIKVGDPLHEDVQMGAMISEDHLHKVLSYVEIGQHTDQARLVCGGKRLRLGAQGTDGFFMEPTIFADCTDDMVIVKSEIFGPVATILKFETEAEVVSRANASSFGLAGGVYSRNTDRARRVADQLNVGTCWINCYNLSPVSCPFGGVNMSGIGRENGSTAAIECYSQLKTTYVGANEQEVDGCSGRLIL